MRSNPENCRLRPTHANAGLLAVISVFYHCWWRRDAARTIMIEQMRKLKQYGLEDAASEIHIGFQGSPEGLDEVKTLRAPTKAQVHNLQESLGELPTLAMIHPWAKAHPGSSVCYFHAKGASHNDATSRWRHCMEKAVLWRWNECVEALKSVDSVGAHWMSNAHGQWFWGGNFWWCTSDYLAALPPPESFYPQALRWGAELWVSNVTKTPTVKDLMSDHALGACP